ncbi:MAG TPA: SMC family ATPase, partial [Luteitalea sp.]|nr:SMC family ATPase [Luteitalea sp.]
MRPITLRVSGFTCFREDQPALDFSALDLFAITGPTGAGKSSVLDAITYALYGRVPRMGKQGVRELISHGRDRLTVMLAFAVGGQHYVVSRTTRRSGGTQCQLDALHGNASTPVASGVKPVGEAVTRILGLDYDAFTQAVLLPQGEFSRFLKGAAADRRRILQELLRLTLYGRMREIAGQRHATARARTAALTQQLEGLELATPAALALQENERRDLVASLESLRAAVEARRAEREAINARVQLHRERQARTLELHALDAQASEQESRDARLERARAARVATPLLDVLERDEAALRGRERDRKTAASEARTTRAAETRARKTEADARAAAAEIPSLQARIDALRSLEGRLEHRAALERDHRRLEVESRDVDLLVGDQARRCAAAEKAHAEAVTRLQTADTRRQQSGYDDVELSACEAHRDRAIELQRDREAVPAAIRRVLAAEARRDEARQTHDAALAAVEDASATHDRAIVERDAAWRHQQTLWDRHRAMTLRARLAPGHACPVCEQHVDAVPAVVPGPDQTEADDAANETAEAVQLAVIQLRQSSDAASRAAATVQGAEHDLARLSEDATGLQARIAAGDDHLRRAVDACMPANAADAVATADAWILARLAVLREARTMAEVAAREWQVAREVAA